MSFGPLKVILLTVILYAVSILFCLLYFVRIQKAFTNLQTFTNQKYITCTFVDPEGLGNQLYRFLSLYGIGRQLGRIPYVDAQNLKQIKLWPSISRAFPMLNEIIQIRSPPPDEEQFVRFANDCCKFEDPQELAQYSSKYLRISAKYLQVYKFFDDYKEDVRQIMQCGASVQQNADTFAENLFKNDSNHKMCVHIRRGDFFKSGFIASSKENVIPMLKYAFAHFTESGLAKNISLVFMGQDPSFQKSLSVDDIGFDNVFRYENQPREEEMCFGMKYCDSMVVTASGSTYAWWISYLMKPNSTIFYNSHVTKKGNFSKDMYDYDSFPSDWIKLTIFNGTAKNEQKWWFERRATKQTPN